MKLFAAVLCFLFAAIAAQECPQQTFLTGDCPPIARRGSPCKNPCNDDPDDVITAVENCTVAYCCVVDNECRLRGLSAEAPALPAPGNGDVDVQTIVFVAQFNRAQQQDRQQNTSSSGNSTEGGDDLDGRFGNAFGGPTYCPTFPFNCNIQQPGYGPVNYAPPFDIPYCQRIACEPSNPFLDNDFQACISQPGCYFDNDLFAYRNLVGQSILPGVPVCHRVIRNRAFQKRAQEAAQTLGAWNPILTECVFTQYREEIFGDAVGCQLLDYLVYFGHTPKRAGWRGINERQCALIGACWRRTATNAFCAYPTDAQGRPTVRSSNNEDNSRTYSSSSYGLPVCYPLDASSTPSDFLTTYHTCLASGCAANVDRQTLWDYLIGLGSGLRYPLNLQYINMVHSGSVRPDNYQSALDNLLNRPTFPGFPGPGPYPQPSIFPPFTLPTFPPFPTNIPYSFNLRNGSVSTESPRYGLVGNAGGQPPFGFPGAGAGVGGAGPGYGGSPNPGFPFPPQGFPGFPQPPPVNPCPYQAPQYYPGLPRLTGSFAGCCEQPLCYTPKTDLYNSYSGISSYLSHWSEWSECDAECGGGLQNRTRVCIGNNCPSNALLLQTRSCNAHVCPTYTNWGRWGACSSTCGGGRRSRSRTCQGQGSCKGPAMESRPCRTGACPTYSYLEWSSCSNTCGRGVRRRQRSCTNGGAYGCGRTTPDEGPCEQFCGKSEVQCNPQTCCYEVTCTQANGRPGYCASDDRVGNRCYQGFCLFNQGRTCNNPHAG